MTPCFRSCHYPRMQIVAPSRISAFVRRHRCGPGQWACAAVGLLIAAAAGPAVAQPILNANAVPKLDAASRATYKDFLLSNLPRAFAIGSHGSFGWQGGSGTLETVLAKALESCAAKAATGPKDCMDYAENLDVVWEGRARQPTAVPDPFISTWNYSIAPDSRYFWRGPATAAGVYVWGHGLGSLNGAGALADARGSQPQPHVRAFNSAGFDVVRFDRHPNADARDRAAGWLEQKVSWFQCLYGTQD